MRKSIEKQVLENQQDMIVDIQKLIAIPSIHGNFAENERALDYVLNRAQEMGFKTMKASTGDVGIVEYGYGEEIVGLLVHVDVVHVGEVEKWQFPPFEATVSEDFLYGRGAIDDKGPAVMSLYALKVLKDMGASLNKRIWLIIGTCEEGHWTDMEHYKAEFPLPDYGFSPDGGFPIVHIEKGYIDVELLFKEAQLEEIEVLTAGESTNSIPAKAMFQRAGEPPETFTGKSAHSSAPEDGDNAIVRMAMDEAIGSRYRFAQMIRDHFSADGHAVTLALDDSSGSYDGEDCGRTTCVPTVIRKVPEGVWLNLNIRQQFGTGLEDVERAFDALKERYGYSFEIKEFLAATMVSQKLQHLQEMKALYNAYGQAGDFTITSGTTYAKAMPNMVAWGPVLPEDPDCAHQENERLALKTMLFSTGLYVHYLGITAGEWEIADGYQSPLQVSTN